MSHVTGNMNAKFVHAIHVDIPEWDRSTMTRRYIREQEIFSMAENILCGRNYFVWQELYWGRREYILGQVVLFVTRNISCSGKYFLR